MPQILNRAPDSSSSGYPFHDASQGSKPEIGLGSQGSSAPSLPPETLPPEIWMMIILSLDDHCFAWYILRRVSPFLRSVTESVFAQRIIKDIAIRFAGNGAKNVIVDHLMEQESKEAKQMEQNSETQQIKEKSEETQQMEEESEKTQQMTDARKGHFQRLFDTQHPTFYFEATKFSPPDTKEKVILKLQEPLNSYQNSVFLVAIQQADPHRFKQYPIAFFLRKTCCSCEPQIDTPSDLARCSCLEDIFFGQEKEKRDWIKSSHFVRVGGTLRSASLPSIELIEETREISLDWRRFCQKFYYDELLQRRTEKPWLRDLSLEQKASTLQNWSTTWQSAMAYGREGLKQSQSSHRWAQLEDARKRELILRLPLPNDAKMSPETKTHQRDRWIFWDCHQDRCILN